MLPEVVKNLLIINGLFYLASHVVKYSMGVSLWELLGLHFWFSDAFYPFQFVTHMFMHSEHDIFHIFMNMFVLWMFGTPLENLIGSKRFLQYYLLCGFGAAVLHYLVAYMEMLPTLNAMNTFIAEPSLASINALIDVHKFGIYAGDYDMQALFKNFRESFQTLNTNPENGEALGNIRDFIGQYKEYYLSSHNVVGASGAVFGLLLAYGYLYPNRLLYLYFMFPIKAKYAVAAFAAFELYTGISNNPNDNVAHFAHLGGMIVGYLLLKYWGYKRLE